METLAETVTRIYNAKAKNLLRDVVAHYRGLDYEACEDVVADIFRKLFVEVGEGRLALDESRVDGLLWTWAGWAAKTELRRRQRQATPEESLEDHADDETANPLHEQLRTEKDTRRQLALEGALTDFTRDCENTQAFVKKAVFEGRVVLNWKSDRVAQYLGIPKDRVFSLAFSTRKWVIERLRDFYDPHATLFASRYATRHLARAPVAAAPAGAVASKAVAKHVDEAHLLAYLDESLDDYERRAVEEHVASCQGCRRLLESLKVLSRQAFIELEMNRTVLAALCPARERLARLAYGGSMEPVERRELLLHVKEGGCPRCRRLLSALYQVDGDGFAD